MTKRLKAGESSGHRVWKCSEWIDIVCQERKPQKLQCIVRWDVELLVPKNQLLNVEWQGGIHYTKREDKININIDLANTEARDDSGGGTHKSPVYDPLEPFYLCKSGG